eukprot:762949-Hanusia_phi.AAC.8
MEEKKNFEDKTLTAVLTGVNRALPFLPATDAQKAQEKSGKEEKKGKRDLKGDEKLSVAAVVIGEHLDSIFKMVYVATFNTSIQALQVTRRGGTMWKRRNRGGGETERMRNRGGGLETEEEDEKQRRRIRNRGGG